MNLILAVLILLLAMLCIWLALTIRRLSRTVAVERLQNEVVRTQLSGVEAEALRLHTVRRDFVANISHELRTPLASIKLLVETLEDGALHDETVAGEFLHKIGQETEHLIAMAQELLDLARLEAAPSVQPRALDPAMIVAHAAERMRELARDNEVRLQLNLPPALPRIWADDEQVGRVFVNLLSNAITYTPPGGMVTIGARVDENMLAFSVSDTGPGIPPGEEARIFERFYKADVSRRHGGAGLGLSIARHIVEAHGGTIWARNRPEAEPASPSQCRRSCQAWRGSARRWAYERAGHYAGPSRDAGPRPARGAVEPCVCRLHHAGTTFGRRA